MGLNPLLDGCKQRIGVVLFVTLLALTGIPAQAAEFSTEDGTDIWIVGLGSLEIGPSIEETDTDETYWSRLEIDGRMAFYLQGKIKGEYLIKAALDTGKEPLHVFEQIEPERYYPVYGDFSTVENYTTSHGRYYILVEKNDSYLTYGKYTTEEFTDTGLGFYDRSLRGAKVHYLAGGEAGFEDRCLQVTAVFAATPQEVRIDEFPIPEHCPGELNKPPRPDPTGPYYLTYLPVVPQTERVSLIVRDSSTNRILKTTDLQPDQDYIIEYETGRIELLIEPPARCPRGHPMFLRVRYEHVAKDSPSLTNIQAIRLSKRFSSKLFAGVTYISEERAVEENEDRLAVADFVITFPLFELAGEYACSDLVASRDNTALLLNLSAYPTDNLTLQSNYQYFEPNFASYGESIADLKAVETTLELRVNDFLSFSADHYHQGNNVVGEEGVPTISESSGGLRANYASPAGWQITAGLQRGHSRETELLNGVSSTYADTVQVSRSAEFFTPVTDRLQLVLAGERVTDSCLITSLETNTDNWSLSLPYRLGDTTDLELHYTRSVSIAENGEQTERRQGYGILMSGVLPDGLTEVSGSLDTGTEEFPLYGESSRFNEYSLELFRPLGQSLELAVSWLGQDVNTPSTGSESLTRSSAIELTGYLTDAISSTVSFSREAFIESDEFYDYESVSTMRSLTVDIAFSESLSCSTFLEESRTAENDTYESRDDVTTTMGTSITYYPIATLPVQLELSRASGNWEVQDTMALTLSGRTGMDWHFTGQLQHDLRREPNSSVETYSATTGYFGAAYRSGCWQGLARIDYGYSIDLLSDPAVETRNLLTSVEVCRSLFDERVDLSSKYVRKHSIREDTISSADLVQAEATYYITEPLGITGRWRQFRNLESSPADRTLSSAVEMSYQLIDGLKLAVGYNFQDYQELRLNQIYQRGAGLYVRLAWGF